MRRLATANSVAFGGTWAVRWSEPARADEGVIHVAALRRGDIGRDGLPDAEGVASGVGDVADAYLVRIVEGEDGQPRGFILYPA